jgi:hypothetical protein
MAIDETPTPMPELDKVDEDGRKLAVVYRSRVQWEDLQQTENDQVRYCTNCSQPVFHIADAQDLHRAVAAGRCVMVKPPKPRGHFLGMPAFIDSSEKPLQWDD